MLAAVHIGVPAVCTQNYVPYVASGPGLCGYPIPDTRTRDTRGFLLPDTRYPLPELRGRVTGNFCLLYTSPSPRDLSTSRMPSSA